MSLQSFFSRTGAQVRLSLRAMFRRSRLEEEMDAELQIHLESLTADLVRAGHSPSEAARRARIALGPALVHKEGMRASLGLRWWDELRADLRYGIRILRKSPGFTAIAATSLALAIGANTTIFSIAKQLLYDRLNVPHPEQLRMLRWNDDGKVVVQEMWGDFDDASSSVFSYPVYVQLKAHNQVMGDLFAFKEDGVSATIRGNAQRVNVAMVSGNFYEGIEVRPQLGRPLQPSDDVASSTGTVAVISDGVWEQEFARSPDALGQTIKLNQAIVTIVGVNPPGFTGAKNVQMSPDVFVPLTLQPLLRPMNSRTARTGHSSLMTDTDLWWLNVMGRTRAGVKDSEAQAALNVQLQAAVRATMALKAGDTLPRLDLSDGARGLHFADSKFKRPFFVLMPMTGFVVLLACANIANLLLARASQRQREMSVRLAVGAGRGRILRQLLTESMLLAVIGGAGGLLLGYVGRNAIPVLLNNAWERNNINSPFDWGIFAFTAGVTLLTGVLFGLAPAWLAAGADMGSNLKEAAQSTTRRRRGLSGKAIVAFQVALSTLLVVGAGLFLRTLFALNATDVGFSPDKLLLFEIQQPPAKYPAGKDIQLHERLEHAFAAAPGVDAVTLMWEPYIANEMSNADFLPEGENYGPGHFQAEFINEVGNDFFQTMGIPIISGRGFGLQDTATSQKVAVINRSLARKRFGNANPIGKRFKFGDIGKGDWVQIVGVCSDTLFLNLRDAPPAQFLVPYVQGDTVRVMTYAIRTRQRASSIVPSLRKIVRSLDPDLPMIDVRSQREQIDSTMQVERMFAALTAGFGMLALTLACVGIYGVMAYNVAQRTNEIGIRLALGAQPAQLRAMILRESTGVTLVGIVVGVWAALLLTRAVKSMLYGIQPYDPLTYSAGILILITVALAASWIPARRAAGVQPMEALRHE